MTTLYPLNDDIGSVALVEHAGSDKSVVNAARVSFSGDSDTPLDAKDAKLIHYLLKHNHGSPFEHNLLTFKVVCPIFVDRQMVRHRVGVSKNEISGRYVELQDRVYVPTEFRRQAESNRQASVPDDGSLNQEQAERLWVRGMRLTTPTRGCWIWVSPVSRPAPCCRWAYTPRVTTRSICAHCCTSLAYVTMRGRSGKRNSTHRLLRSWQSRFFPSRSARGMSYEVRNDVQHEVW